jgi:hypothetical protein
LRIFAHSTSTPPISNSPVVYRKRTRKFNRLRRMKIALQGREIRKSGDEYRVLCYELREYFERETSERFDYE